MTAVQDEIATTPICRRMLAVLADGRQHTPQELHACLYETMAPLSNIRAHITALRKLVAPRGEAIVCVRLNGRSIRYQHVRLLHVPDPTA